MVFWPFLAWAGLLILNTIVTARSQITALQRNGIDYDPLHAWMMEGSSALFLIAAFVVVVVLARRFPLDQLLVDWRVGLVYLAGSVVFSVIHTIGMVALRFALWPPLFSLPYDAPSSVLGSFLFEYQKDLIVFIVAVLGMYLFRAMMDARRAMEAARQDARTTHRITLKCGVRSIYAEAREFVCAKAAANYAEAEFGPGRYFARISLAELESQLKAAGIRAARVHKSWLINLDRVSEVAPSGDGGRIVTLSSGHEIPVGRRFREIVDPPSGS
jgi:hypothetical protein